MGLSETLNQDLKSAMKAGKKHEVEAIRSLKSALRDKEIEKRGDLSEQDTLQVLSTAAKRRRESIESYEKGGRDDLVEQEKAELEVIEKYLPKQLSDNEIGKIVDEVIADTGASTIQDMGKVMGQVMPKVRGQADGNAVQNIVKEKLS